MATAIKHRICTTCHKDFYRRLDVFTCVPCEQRNYTEISRAVLTMPRSVAMKNIFREIVNGELEEFITF